MKAKIGFDKKAVQRFFLENTEKILFGAVILVFLLLVYRSIFRDWYRNTPDKLKESCNSATAQIQRTSPSDIKLETDYARMAARSQKPIDPIGYDHGTPWNPPIFPSLRLRPNPPILALQALRALAGRGPVSKTTGGPLGGADSDAQGIEGRRWVILTALVPVKEQTNIHKQAFQDCQLRNSATDAPSYTDFIVERAEVTDPSPNAQLQWIRVDPEKKETGRSEAGAEEVINERFRHAVLTQPLPPLPPGRQWGPEIRHPRLTGPSLEWVLANPEAAKGQTVIWQGKQYDEAKSRVIYTFGAGSSAAAAAPRYFAVDIAVGPRPPREAVSIITGAVQGVEAIAIRVEQATATSKPGFKDVLTRMPVLKYSVEDGGDASAPAIEQDGLGGAAKPKPEAGEGKQTKGAHLLFRFADLSVESGKTYRYRVRLGLANPNYNLPARYLEKPESAKEAVLWSDSPALSEVTSVPRDTQLSVVSVFPSMKPGTEPTGKIRINKFVVENGELVIETFSVLRGSVANFPNRVAHVAKPAGGGGTEKTRNTFNVDFLSDAVVLDLRGGERSRRGNVTEVPEMLVLEPDGTMTAHNEIDDTEALRQHGESGPEASAEPESAAPPAPKPPRTSEASGLENL